MTEPLFRKRKVDHIQIKHFRVDPDYRRGLVEARAYRKLRICTHCAHYKKLGCDVRNLRAIAELAGDPCGQPSLGPFAAKIKTNPPALALPITSAGPQEAAVVGRRSRAIAEQNLEGTCSGERNTAGGVFLPLCDGGGLAGRGTTKRRQDVSHLSGEKYSMSQQNVLD